MKILVTGASGLLGRSVAQTLLALGHQVRVLQRRSAGLECDEVRGDITNQQVVRAAVRDQDAVVHLAARVSPTGSWRDFHDVNVGGTQHLLDASNQSGVSRFIYVSSPAVASSGAAHVGACSLAADPDRTKSHYVRSKAMAEQLVLAAGAPDSAAMMVAAVRPHLVWGPGDEQLVARIVERAKSGSLRVLGSGAALVDSTYIDNAADAIAAAVERAEVIRGRSLVISNGEPRPVGELLGGLCRAAGLPTPQHHVPALLAKAGGAVVEAVWTAGRFAQDPPMTRFLAEQLSTAHWYDQRETRALLAWTPRVSIDQGLTELARWFRTREDEAS